MKLIWNGFGVHPIIKEPKSKLHERITVLDWLSSSDNLNPTVRKTRFLNKVKFSDRKNKFSIPFR